MKILLNNFLVFIIIAILCYSCHKDKEPKILIATSANMQFAMQEITASFTKKTGIKCELIVASSGKLTAQILQGAPFDIFVSADAYYPQTIYEAKKAMYPPKTYAYGKLILWATQPEIKPDLQFLTSSQIQHIAIANPKTAPYGKAALEILKKLPDYKDISHKLVFTENIMQINQLVEIKAVEIGITAQSILFTDTHSEKNNWSYIHPNLYPALEQSCVLIKHQNQQRAAQEFYTYLFSLPSQKILQNFGYLVPENI